MAIELIVCNWIMVVCLVVFVIDAVADTGGYLIVGSILVAFLTVILGYGIVCGENPSGENEIVSTTVPKEMAASENYVFAKVNGKTVESEKHVHLVAFKEKQLAVQTSKQLNAYRGNIGEVVEFVVTNMNPQLILEKK